MKYSLGFNWSFMKKCRVREKKCWRLIVKKFVMIFINRKANKVKWYLDLSGRFPNYTKNMLGPRLTLARDLKLDLLFAFVFSASLGRNELNLTILTQPGSPRKRKMQKRYKWEVCFYWTICSRYSISVYQSQKRQRVPQKSNMPNRSWSLTLCPEKTRVKRVINTRTRILTNWE